MNKNKFEDNSVSNSDIDKCYTVYMHISPSGKRYIGITRQEQEKDGKMAMVISRKNIFIKQYLNMAGIISNMKYCLVD